MVTNQGKRADGLIAVLGSHLPFTASLEAKSYRTLASMIPVIAEESWVWHGFIAVIVSYVLVAFIFHQLFHHWVLVYLLPVLPAVIIGFGYLLLTDELVLYHKTAVVNQLKQYPANEQWLAISTDANRAIAGRDLEELKRVCSQRGIGLLTVTNSKKVVVQLAAKLRKSKKNFLPYYSKSKKVQQWV